MGFLPRTSDDDCCIGDGTDRVRIGAFGRRAARRRICSKKSISITLEDERQSYIRCEGWLSVDLKKYSLYFIQLRMQ